MAEAAPQNAGIRRLVVGGGRAPGFPVLAAGDIALNIVTSANPHLVADIAFAPLRAASCDTIYFERMPFPAFTGSRLDALAETARLLRPGGRLTIETGWAAPAELIMARLQAEGFIIVSAERNEERGGLFRILALMPGVL